VPDPATLKCCASSRRPGAGTSLWLMNCLGARDLLLALRTGEHHICYISNRARQTLPNCTPHPLQLLAAGIVIPLITTSLGISTVSMRTLATLSTSMRSPRTRRTSPLVVQLLR
jgi:hypothetical protein